MDFVKSFWLHRLDVKLVLFALWCCALSGFSAELSEAQKLNIAFESLSRLRTVDAEKNPAVKNAVANLLVKTHGTPQFVQIVEQLGLKNQDDALLEIARKDPSKDHGVEAMRLILDHGNSAWLRQQFETDAAPEIVEALGNTGKKESVPLLLEILTNGNRTLTLRQRAVRSCAQSSEGATHLLNLAKEGALPPELQLVAAGELHRSQWQSVKEDAAKILPMTQSQEANALPRVADLLKLKGNAARGEKVFFRAETACSTCHQIRGRGTEIGPALSEIGKKLGKEALFEAVLEPSAGISFGYEANQLELKGGDEAYGLIVSETDDEIAIKDLKGIVARYKKGEIVRRQQLKTSIMPTGLQQTMSAQDLADLVAFLSSLRN